jgi:hypothetical protein
MKTGTPDSIKFRRLQRRLKTSTVITVGTLELLWITTARNAPQGDIGRFSNEEIAIACDWPGDPDELVNALVECGWLDCHDYCRLVVHDWAEHCPNHVKGTLARWNKSFAVLPTVIHNDALPSKFPRDHNRDVPREVAYQRPTKPSQAKLSQVKPIHTAAAVDAATFLKGLDLEAVRLDAKQLYDAIPFHHQKSMSRDYIWQVCVIAKAIDPLLVSTIVSSIRGGDILKPKNYIDKVLRDECATQLQDLRELRSHCPPTPPPPQPPGPPD